MSTRIAGDMSITEQFDLDVGLSSDGYVVLSAIAREDRKTLLRLSINEQTAEFLHRELTCILTRSGRLKEPVAPEKESERDERPVP